MQSWEGVNMATVNDCVNTSPRNVLGRFGPWLWLEDNDGVPYTIHSRCCTPFVAPEPPKWEAYDRCRRVNCGQDAFVEAMDGTNAVEFRGPDNRKLAREYVTWKNSREAPPGELTPCLSCQTVGKGSRPDCPWCHGSGMARNQNKPTRVKIDQYSDHIYTVRHVEDGYARIKSESTGLHVLHPIADLTVVEKGVTDGQ